MASLIGPSTATIIYAIVGLVVLVLLVWLLAWKKHKTAAILCAVIGLIVLIIGYGLFSWFAPVHREIRSDVYTEAEMDAAVDAIMAEDLWSETHSRPLDIHYVGDDESEQNLSYVQSLFPDKKYTQCAVFETDFRSAFLSKNSGSLEPREVYTGFRWYLARTDGGKWEVVTGGYA